MVTKEAVPDPSLVPIPDPVHGRLPSRLQKAKRLGDAAHAPNRVLAPDLLREGSRGLVHHESALLHRAHVRDLEVRDDFMLP